MSAFNKVIIMGNLTRDPEIRYTAKGLAVGKITLAVNRKWKSETGEQKEEVTFIDVDAFGKQAETIGQYMRKGRALFVEGRLKLDKWQDKQTGANRSRLGVVLESFQFIDAGGERTDGAAPAPRAAAAPPSAPADEPPMEGDDVPF